MCELSLVLCELKRSKSLVPGAEITDKGLGKGLARPATGFSSFVFVHGQRR